MARQPASTLGFGLALLWVLSSVVESAPPGRETAQVSENLRGAPAYHAYVQILVQLDLLANPATASLPITIETSADNQLQLRGVVTGSKLRDYVLSNARRISGLPVRDGLRIASVPQGYLVDVSPDELEVLTGETITTLFPELASDVRTTVTKEGVVVLNGTAPSYEAKLLLSQAVKSQPGCRAVVNLLLVTADSDTGLVTVTEAGDRLRANDLPIIPAAPLVDTDRLTGGDSTLLPAGMRTAGSADDSVQRSNSDRQLLEDVKSHVDRHPTFTGVDFEIDVRFGVVTITGAVDQLEDVETLVDLVSALPGVTKVAVKCRPYSLQRIVPATAAESETLKEPPSRFRLPFFSSDEALHLTRRSRERVRKTIEKRCGGRVAKVSVQNYNSSLRIEAEVSNSRDRNFVFSEVDNVVELRNVKYDLLVKQAEK